ncbi:MAG: gliding motility-associated C-terminal domain-containing protein [Flavobacteriaceae bacterium]|nr:gliding motility-associated C-terminal domain-containing protein [Flavobacteriaceae bacterium]
MEAYDNSWTGKRQPKLTKFGREELIEGAYFYVLSFSETEGSERSEWIYITE